MKSGLRWLTQSRSVMATCTRFLLVAVACVVLIISLDSSLQSIDASGLIWRNAVPVILLGFLIYALCGRAVFSVWLTVVLMYVLYAVNAIKERNMNMPLMPGDLVLEHQVLGNVGFFEHYTIHGVLAVIAIIGFLVISWLIWRMERHEARPAWFIRIAWVILPLICFVTMFRGDGIWASVYSKQALAGFQLWDPAKSVAHAGLVAGLVHMSQESKITIPKPNKAVVRQFASTHAASLKARADRPVSKDLPDIVVVQSEAFFDPGIMKQISPGEFDPNFERLSKTGITGALTTPAYGGGTIRTEFDTLTGYPISAFPSVVYPYYGLAASWMPSVPRRLVSMGYSTTLFHPFLGEFWNRREVMPELGFQKMYFEKAFRGAKHAGRYVSDHALFQFVLQHLKGNNANPQYVMVITMENHGPWHHDAGKLTRLLKGHVLPAGLSAAGRQQLTYYLSHLVNGDAALGEFAKALLARKRWTVLVFYGDHLPALNQAFKDIGFDDGQTHTAEHTRYMLISNRPLKSRTLDIDAYELPGLLFDTIGLPMDGYLAFDGAIREAWAKDNFQQGAVYGQIYFNAARMEVKCRHKLTLDGYCGKHHRQHVQVANVPSSHPPSETAECRSGSCDNGDLSLSPASAQDCQGGKGPFAVTVHWREPGVENGVVRIWVRSPNSGGTATLWAEQATAGSATTGKWIYPGTKIILTDVASGDKLSVLTVPASACGGS